MKKFMMGAAAFCCMLFSSVALNACGSDNNDDDDSGKTDSFAPKEALLEVWCAEKQEFLDVYDVTVTINGQSETISSSTWSKSVKSNGLPTHYSINVKMTKKAGKDWEADKMYDFTLPAIKYKISVIRVNGETAEWTLKEPQNRSLGGKFMDLTLEKFGEFTAEYDIDKNGKLPRN